MANLNKEIINFFEKISQSKLLFIPIGIIPFIVFLLHIKLFGDYIIDDAGILFAYARNMANGYGIVAQPGLTPVEGCSDFLWLMLFVPFFWLKIFDPVLTSKIFSAVIVLVLYLLFSFRLKKDLPLLLILIFLVFLSITTPFAIWNSSGLENPLYVLLIVILFYQSHEILITNNQKFFISAGFVAFLIAITRPDGVLYSFALPLLLVVHHFLNKKIKLIPWKKLFLYAGIFGASYGLLLVFRYNYFGELVPNTYYFKGGPKLEDVGNILLLKQEIVLKLEILFSSVIGKFSFITMVILLLINCWIFFTKRFSLFHFALTFFFIFAVLNFLLMPYDWMGEFRFATPFIIFFYLFLISSLFTLFSQTKYPILITCLTLCGIGYPMIKDFHSRSIKFAQSPTVPFKNVTQEIGLKFNEYEQKLGVTNASLLTPDCGGTLFYSKLRVYDMAGLIDKRYAIATLGKDNETMYKLIFDIDKPTFIEIHSDWSYHIQLQNNPRFYQEYAPIVEIEYELYGRNIKNGHYVRRDAINNNLELLNSIK